MVTTKDWSDRDSRAPKYKDLVRTIAGHVFALNETPQVLHVVRRVLIADAVQVRAHNDDRAVRRSSLTQHNPRDH